MWHAISRQKPARAEADERIAATLGSRTLRGRAPTLDIDPNEIGFEAAVRHYDKAIAYFRELIETEGRSELVPQLEKALTHRKASADALEASGSEGAGQRATRSPRQKVVQKPARAEAGNSFVSWDDLSDP